MTDEAVRFTVSLTVAEGKLDAFEAVAQAMIVGSQHEAGTLVYEFCLSADRKRCRLVEKYIDADAVLSHLTGPVVQELVPKALELATISGFEVYGNPGPKAAEILAGFGAEIFESWHGFSRGESSVSSGSSRVK